MFVLISNEVILKMVTFYAANPVLLSQKLFIKKKSFNIDFQQECTYKCNAVEHGCFIDILKGED